MIFANCDIVLILCLIFDFRVGCVNYVGPNLNAGESPYKVQRTAYVASF